MNMKLSEIKIAVLTENVYFEQLRQGFEASWDAPYNTTGTS